MLVFQQKHNIICSTYSESHAVNMGKKRKYYFENVDFIREKHGLYYNKNAEFIKEEQCL